jgi:NAD(P)-dependent dehydrogenase (short-subunit alcohol dehydrogenase family)
MRLKDKVAVVTGASTGIGLAIAKKLAEEGSRVVIADIREPERGVAEMARAGLTGTAVSVDIASEDSVARMTHDVVERFGAIDILVNNAAISQELRPTPFEKIGKAEFDRILSVNTVGVFLCCRAIAPIMRARKFGRIINLTSATAFKGTPFMLHYVASKGALISMTRALAKELGADNVLVNAIAPGYTLSEGNLANVEFMTSYRKLAIETRAIPRDAYPGDLSGAAAFLASDDASFITGQIIAVDGGSVYH